MNTLNPVPCRLETDVLVLGSGGAGLVAALAAREAGARVVVASKMGPEDPNCTVRAWGGFTYSTDALAGELFRQVVETGGFLNDQRLVETFARDLPGRLQELADSGVPLEVLDGADTEGRLGVTRVIGHGPMTGGGMTQPLRARCEALGVRFLDRLMVSTLLREAGRVTGAAGVTLEDGRLVALSAKATVVATGGGACLWERTDNPAGTTGDGIALAYDAGAELVNLEIVSFQFPRQRFQALIEEGERNPETFLSTGGAHYFVGGIRIDERCRTSVRGLFAAGEATGGVFGAGRLGGSALADLIVFGTIAGREAASEAGCAQPEPATTTLDAERRRLDSMMGEGGLPAAEAAARLRSLMWRGCGLTKTRRSLEETLAGIAALEAHRPEVRVESVAGLREGLECGYLLTLGRLIASASLLRDESRGSYWRLDAPAPDNGRWLRNILLRREGDRDTHETRPVPMTRLTQPTQPRVGPGCFGYLP